MNNGFSIYEQVNPINQDINIVYSPITPVLKYDYYIIKDGVKSGATNISGNTPSNILLTETGNYEIEVNAYDYYNNVTVIKSGIYNIDKEAPVINVKDNNIELELNSAYNFLSSVEVTDNQDSNVSSNILISKDDDFFTTSGIKKVTYTVSDNAGNTTTETLNVNVVDNRISDIAYLFVGMLCIISFVLVTIYYRMTTLVKRVGKYGLEPLDDNTPSLFDQVVKKYTEILAELNKYLEKSVFITKYSKRYNKYLNIVNHNYLNGMYYVSNKVIISIAFLLVALVSEAIRVSTVGFEVVVLSLLVGFFFPDLIYIYKYRKHRGNLENDFLQAIIIMNNAFKSGRSISQAVDIVARELDGPMALEFEKMGLELAFGLSVEVVFRRFSERVNLEEAKYLTASISILNKTGGNIIKVFSSIEKTLFNKKKLKLEMNSLTGASRIIVYALIAVPILFIVFISFINPTYFIPLITTELGYILTTIIIVIYIIYIFFVFKIMKVRM